MSTSGSGVGNKKKSHTQYSTFIDNENYATATANCEGRKNTKGYTDDNPSSATSQNTRPAYNKRLSSSSLHSNYNLPPLPDANAAANVEKAKKVEKFEKIQKR